MYPFLRMFKELWLHRNAPALDIDGTHVSHHICWPWDLDFWMELNNGRTLTLYDLGRIPLARRSGLFDALARNRWGMTMAGACVRYRRRIRAFERFEMRSRAVGHDNRFIYLEQSMWRRDGECANHIMYRAAVTGPSGIVPPAEVLKSMGREDASMDLPDWVRSWIETEALRPWPPMTPDS